MRAQPPWTDCQILRFCKRCWHRRPWIPRRADSAICLDPPPGELAEPITLRDKLACVWKQLLAAPSQISVAVDLRSMTK